jgi:hypothetical protein
VVVSETPEALEGDAPTQFFVSKFLPPVLLCACCSAPSQLPLGHRQVTFVFCSRSLNLLETLCGSKRYSGVGPWRRQLLNGYKIGEDETSEALVKNAETAFALMGSACSAVQERHWDEAEAMLRTIQSMVHQLRVDVRDERLPRNTEAAE